MTFPIWLLVVLVAVTVAIPFIYIAITWDHDVVCSYPMLPAPSDLGTKEFRWRCYWSSMVRHGWRRAILHSACPRITLQSRFALLSTDFAKMTTSLGFQELKLETIPFIFPQIAASGLLLQLLGNSNFPAALTGIKTKSLTICQVRALDMRFRDQVESESSETESSETPGLHCVMVLTEKRFLEAEIEFSVQTDLFDDKGTVWQSTTCLSVPFTQETLLAPLSSSAIQLDATLLARPFGHPQRLEFACTSRQLDEFEQVSITNLDGTTTNRTITPRMWLVGRAFAALQQQKRLPPLPLMCSMVFHDDNDDDGSVVPIQSRVTCESQVSQEGQEHEENAITKVVITTHGKKTIATGLLRTVGWVQAAPQPGASTS